MVTKAFSGLLDGLKSINYQSIAQASVEAHKPEIEDLNTDQLNAGQNAKGQPIRPPYRPLTVVIKQAKGQSTNRVTLKDEGDFHKSIFVKTHQNAFELEATDPKTAALTDKYGEEILGLTEANIAEASEIIEDTFVKLFEQQFNQHASKKSR